MSEAQAAGRPRAFVLLGGLHVIVRNWLYLTELDRRGLKVLVITSANSREETLDRMATEGDPAALIAEARFVEGRVGIEGHFTSGVIATVREWCARYDVVGVFAAGEMMVEQTGIVADALGLPSPGLRATRACRSKYLQRWYLPDLSPRAVIVPASDRERPATGDLRFPAVLKPSGRRSSSGVQEVGSHDELVARMVEYPAAETLLVEEYVSGPEFSVEALVQRGRILFESVTEKQTNESTTSSFVELRHTVPAPPGPGADALLAATRTIVERLAFSDGVVHAELRLVDGDRPVLMEVAARTPGDGLLPLYQLATGRSMEPEIMRIALGEPASYPPLRRLARQVYLDHPHGVLKDVVVRWPGAEAAWVGEEGLWPPVAPGAPGDGPALRAVLVFKDRGARLGPLRESDDRAVTFLVDAATRDELDEVERRAREAIEIVVV